MHGCFSYGTDDTMIKYLWNEAGGNIDKVPVIVNGEVILP